MVAVDGSPERKVSADFDGPVPHYVEWDTPVAFNAEVTCNSAVWYAAGSKACSGLYHIKLMPERRYPVEAAEKTEDAPVDQPNEQPRKRKSK